jgi:signal transduction histidine kinase
MGHADLVQPLDADPTTGHGDRWLFPVLGGVGLALGTIFTQYLGPAGQPTAGTLVLIALAFGWLVASLWLLPRRSAHPWLGPAYFLGLLTLGMLLAMQSPAFFAFSWIGYPYGFTLFAGPWIIVMVTATAISQYVALIVVGIPSEALIFILPVGILVPVVVAGWIGTVADLRARRANAELAAANRRLATALDENADLQDLLLEQARVAGQLEERQRVAREIHDTLAQGLTGIVTQVRAAEQAAGEPDQWRFHLDRVEALARESLAEARRSVQALRPGGLADSQLPRALSSLGERWSEEQGIPAIVEITGAPVPLPTAIEVALFRAAQEALTNVAKHARASRVVVTLSFLDDLVLLDVRDDGAGFDPGSPVTQGFGLEAMRQRIHALGGTLEVESSEAAGTAISAAVPAIPERDRS